MQEPSPRVEPTGPALSLTTEEHRIKRTFFERGSGSTFAAIQEIPGRRRLDGAALAAFLHIGYVPGTGTLFEGVDCLPGGCEIVLSPPEWRVVRRLRYGDRIDGELKRLGSRDLEARGAAILREAVSRCAALPGQIVVPLSGGLDSRTLLAALLELVPAHDIQTYTYGIPGSADFEIGNRVAKLAGTRHATIDMRTVPFTIEGLVETARMTDANACVFHPYVWREVKRRFGEGVRYWSGFTGDGLGGSFFQSRTGSTAEAVQAFVKGESFFSVWRAPSQPLSGVARYVAETTKYDGLLSPFEAVWFENHVERYTAHQIFLVGLQYAAPFMDADFIAFMLGVLPEQRQGKLLFNRLVSKAFPRLFQVPTRDYGYKLARRPLRHAIWRASSVARKALYRVVPRLIPHPNLTYADFNQGLRHRADVRATARELLDGLKQRNVVDGAEVERVWTQHRRGARCADTIMLLASVEANARAFCD